MQSACASYSPIVSSAAFSPPEGTMPRLFTLLIGLSLAPAVARSDTAASKKPLTAEALWQLTRLGPPTLSPDGKWAVLAATTYDIKTDKPSSALWLIPTAGGEGRQLTAGSTCSAKPHSTPAR